MPDFRDYSVGDKIVVVYGGGQYRRVTEIHRIVGSHIHAKGGGRFHMDGREVNAHPRYPRRIEGPDGWTGQQQNPESE